MFTHLCFPADLAGNFCSLSEAPIDITRSSRCVRVLGLEPGLGRAGAIRCINLFRDDPLQPKFTGSGEHFRAIPLDMLDVLNAAFGASEQLAQRRLAAGKWFAPQIVAIEHQQIEGTGDRCVIHDPAVQCVELRNASASSHTTSASMMAKPLIRAACSTMPG